MIDYPAALAVAMVVRTGSFEKAARALHLTPSAVSQRVKSIEDRLGTALIVRGTPCMATGTGAWLCRHVEQVGLLERDLLKQLPGLGAETGPGRVTVSVATNSDSLATWFLGAVAEFTAETATLVNIAVDDEDFTTEWLASGRVVAAVTSDPKAVRGSRVFRIGALRYVATASPAFVARHFGKGVTTAAVAHAPSLTFNQKDRLQETWLLHHVPDAPARPTHWIPSTQGFLDACLLGMGWCMTPLPLAAPHLQAGRLQEIRPGAVLDVPLYWQVSRLVAAPLSALSRAVTRAAAGHLVAADPSLAPSRSPAPAAGADGRKTGPSRARARGRAR